MGFWSVVQTESRREHVAARFLEQGDFKIYFPRTINPRIITSRITSRQRVVPLFPGYLFVEVGQDRWWSARWTIGVVRVLMMDDRPAYVPDEFLDMMRAREVNGLIRLAQKPKPRGIGKGDMVLVLRGSLEGRTGIYQGQSGAHRSRILLNLLGREVPTVVNLRDIARIGQVPAEPLASQGQAGLLSRHKNQP